MSCFDVDKDLCIEIKLGKDHDKQKTLVGSSAVQAVATGSASGTRTPGTGLPGNGCHLISTNSDLGSIQFIYLRLSTKIHNLQN